VTADGETDLHGRPHGYRGAATVVQVEPFDEV